VNLEIIDGDRTVTEILEPGARVTAVEQQLFWDDCERLLRESSAPGIVIASGSLPAGVAPDFYLKLTALVHRMGHKIFVDTSGEPMRLALAAGPDFVKPNRDEAEGLVGKEISDRGAQAAALEHLLHNGALGAAVSLGRSGLVWRNGRDPHIYFAAAPTVDAQSSVGCGDSALAAFAYASAAAFDAEKTLRLAVACGSANCLADTPGRLRESDVRALEPHVRIEKLN
jgi:tagatose 6-phosphate kinase